eukprot:jgi/Orpsp1_1/1180616/evm.model.c7180000074110.1
MVLSNYLILYMSRLLRYMLRKNDEESKIISSLINKFKYSNINYSNNYRSTVSSSGRVTTSINSEKIFTPTPPERNSVSYNSKFSSLLKFHYQSTSKNSLGKNS